MRPRLLFYCQHSVGLGHLVRSMNLATGLAGDYDVTLLNGGPWPPDLPQPDDVEIVHLPPLGLDADSKLVSRDGHYTVEEAVAIRRRVIGETFRAVAPDVVLVELFPFGRKKFSPELLPLLGAARAARPAPIVACSVRDILVGSRSDQQAFDDRASRTCNQLFDAVLVHADARFVSLDETFHPTVPLRTPVHYTGFVRAPVVRDLTRPRHRRVLVSAGGGLVGEPLFRAAVEAHPRLLVDHGLRTTIVAGPFLPDAVLDDLLSRAAETSGLEVIRYVADLGAEMAVSVVSVSQAGYNTTMDILGCTTPSIVVPFCVGREDEQAERARRLEKLDALRVVDADGLSGPVLADAVRDALAWRPLAVPLDLDGRENTAALLRTLRPAQERASS
jgi:predicted glycosyltransferase